MEGRQAIELKPCKIFKRVNQDGRDSGLEFEDSELQYLKVGDIIKLVDDEYVPADCIVLQSAYSNGQTFIQTDALDGEMNLKSKFPLIHCQENVTELLKNRKLSVSIPKPTLDLYNFKGEIDFNY